MKRLRGAQRNVPDRGAGTLHRLAEKAGAVPMLLECEGMDGNLMPGYNAILYVSGAAAVGGLLENGRGRMLGAVVPALAAHWLVGVQHREFERLRAQARRQPRWWNRRLQHQ